MMLLGTPNQLLNVPKLLVYMVRLLHDRETPKAAAAQDSPKCILL
jgi:hypothetical protein